MSTLSSAPAPDPRADVAGFQRALAAWYRGAARPLPWRTAPSLYGTVVSEFMLQQTQVKTVLPYFARWREALPDFAALASAPEAQVLKLWEGLGYYSRARNLQRLARALVALPAIPRTAAAWRELPGVGPYTAAAITSIAFGAPEAVVDGNVVRILARLTADATAFRDSASAARTLAPLATALLATDDPGTHNQAMMELGATVCRRAAPLCLLCPVSAWCAAAKGGGPENAEQFPRLAAKVIERVAVARVWCRGPRGLLLHRTGDGARRLAGLLELPTAEQLGLAPAALAAAPVLATKRRGITRYAITETIHELPAGAAPGESDAALAARSLVWIADDALDTVTLSGPHRRWVDELRRAPR